MESATTEIPQLTKEQQFRFWAKVNKDGPTMLGMDTECWVWTACCDKNGYGIFWANKANFRAHRIAFVLAGGSLDGEKNHACHHCDNPTCVRESHIFSGTCAENNADKGKKGRCNSPIGDRHFSKTKPELLARGERHGSSTHPESRPRGENHPMAKITREAVLSIRAKYAEGGISQKQLAGTYGVSQSHVSDIVLRIRWKQI